MDMNVNDVNHVQVNDTAIVFELMEDELLKISKATVQVYDRPIRTRIILEEEITS